eukprot:CAMPEP_0118678292 /NCGR_PEP_ID=MMETSP0800-20121206/3131_1 /TAXON_ID=210618 ORGANISM="Striatella unipunctata, Strain CCMP2910" /NCGR_SAMPLE_ID=MMETSP0800 /ASSEMBLY_ACC=CAM_ASM_000638 /LENGTH=450 /DNA_ID=CAMNT_0006574119 /DNA_START=126 /DNA_END=1475 /DNA_ORIENTATION=+
MTRVMVARTLDLLFNANSNRKRRARQAVKQETKSFHLCRCLLAEIVVAVKSMLTPIQFASLFLGIGRQMEPHFYHLLFPLPQTSPLEEKSPEDAESTTIDDLYKVAWDGGATAVACASLPLLSSREESYKCCTDLLKHCLASLMLSFSYAEESILDLSAEARTVIHELFLFGLKLEHANHPRKQSVQSNGSATPETPVKSRSSAVVVPPRSSPSMLGSWFSPLVCIGKRGEAKEESEIFEAASSFIMDGFEDYQVDTNYVGSKAHEATGTFNVKGKHTVTTTVADFLLNIIFGSVGGHNHRKRWTMAACVIRLIWTGDQLTDASWSSRLQRGKELTRAITSDHLKAGNAQCFQKKNLSFMVSNKKDPSACLQEAKYQCVGQVEAEDAKVVVEATLLLLSRKEIVKELERTSALVMLTSLAAYVFDRETGALEGSDAEPQTEVMHSSLLSW